MTPIPKVGHLSPSIAPAEAPAQDMGAILVVDDDASNRDSLSRRLQRRGYRTQIAKGGVEALSLIAAQQFDLVLLDVMMPGMSGLEVLAQIRQSYAPSELPVIMATAKDESEDIVRALDLGANDYVTKPLDFSVVVARVKTQLHLRQAVLRILALEEDLRCRNVALGEANEQLLHAASLAKREMETAARIQTALMPIAPPDVAGIRFAWSFQPCQHLAGDSFDAFALGDSGAAFYVLDVSGHGVGSSLLAVAASRLLSITGKTESIASAAAKPAEVANRLNRRLPWDSAVGQFLTLFYAFVDVPSRQLIYASAGHPWAVHISPDGTSQWLDQSGLPIGIGNAAYVEHSVALSPGDRIYLYSDGVTEAMNSRRELFGMPGLLNAVLTSRKLELDASIKRVLEEVDLWRSGAPASDDVTLIAMEFA